MYGVQWGRINLRDLVCLHRGQIDIRDLVGHALGGHPAQKKGMVANGSAWISDTCYGMHRERATLREQVAPGAPPFQGACALVNGSVSVSQTWYSQQRPQRSVAPAPARAHAAPDRCVTVVPPSGGTVTLRRSRPNLFDQSVQSHCISCSGLPMALEWCAWGRRTAELGGSAHAAVQVGSE